MSEVIVERVKLRKEYDENTTINSISQFPTNQTSSENSSECTQLNTALEIALQNPIKLEEISENTRTRFNESNVSTEIRDSLMETVPNQIRVKAEPLEPAAEATNTSTNDAAATTNEAELDAVPDGFFDDLLQSVDELAQLSPPTLQSKCKTSNETSQPTEETTIRIKIERELQDDVLNQHVDATTDGTATAQEDNNESAITTTTRIKNEPSIEQECNDAIPENFFDDLLIDRVAERVEKAVHEDLETKYSEKLKELEALEKLDKRKRDKSHKKHKKTKKKSRKRSRERDHEERSRSRSSERKRHRKSNHEPVATPATLYTRRSPLKELPETSTERPFRVKAEFSTTPAAETASIFGQQLDCLPVHYPSTSTAATVVIDNIAESNACSGLKRIKLEKLHDADADAKQQQPEILTPKQKRAKALQCASNVIMQLLKLKQTDKFKPLSTFHYTCTVRKLPSSSSYVTQQIYENRSPLHTVNNVCYKFNSAATRFDLREWGLEALPSAAANVAKTLGYDVNTLHAKLRRTKLPSNLQRIKKEVNENGEALEETASSFFTNAMTQTDEVTVISGRRDNMHNIAVQATPVCDSMGTQTSGSVTTFAGANSDLPLRQLLSELNENQLLALNDFAELIREPASSAMDMYRLRQRMLDIYKCSQMPSVLQPMLPPPPPLPQATAMPLSHNLGSIYANTDPRSNLMSSFDPRTQQRMPFEISSAYSLTSQPHYGTLNLQPAQPPPKYYGRGSLRR